MSRSYKHSPFLKWSDTNKRDKKAAHRKFRRKEKQNYDEAPIYMREISDTWSFASDGLSFYVGNELLSNDPEEVARAKTYLRK